MYELNDKDQDKIQFGGFYFINIWLTMTNWMYWNEINGNDGDIDDDDDDDGDIDYDDDDNNVL